MSHKSSSKSFFTPCRSVGLKRKSLGTPSPIQYSPKNALEIESDENVVTPKRTTKNINNSEGFSKRRKIPTNLDETMILSATNNHYSLSDADNKVQDEENDTTNLQQQISAAKVRIAKIKIELQSLESVSSNAKQHDIGELEKLIRKWRNGCQEALNDLLMEYERRNNSCTMGTLLAKLGIPTALVHYSENDTDFYE